MKKRVRPEETTEVEINKEKKKTLDDKETKRKCKTDFAFEQIQLVFKWAGEENKWR